MDRYMDIDGIRLHYTEDGPDGAPVLVVMHGWGCNMNTVRSITAVAARTNKVYSVDFPGFGQTPEPPAVWGVEEYTRFIEKFIENLGLERVSLLGHSFGGRVGLLYSSRHDNVDKLILVDAAGMKPHRPLRYYIKVYSFKLAKNAIRLVMPRAKAEAYIEKMRGKRGSADYNAASPRMRAILSKCVNEGLEHVLPDIKAPTLLIWGENDTATPLRDAKYMEKHIKDAGLVSFPGVGHYSFLENPGQFAAVLDSFLRS